MPHRRPVQLDPALYIGPHRILLTMCTFRRTKHFIYRTTVDEVLSQLLRTAASYRIEILAYCFMPDHVHMLVEGLDAESDLLRFIRMFRQRTGHCHRSRIGGRLWQEGYVDTFLRSDQASLDVARYLIGNPIKAGLCADVAAYPYLGSSRYTLDELIGSLA